MNPRKNESLAGQTFGHLTVLSLSHYQARNTYYLCRCTCGTEKTIASSNLGRVSSCGCLKYIRKQA